jgi:hypothetical protein
MTIIINNLQELWISFFLTGAHFSFAFYSIAIAGFAGIFFGFYLVFHRISSFIQPAFYQAALGEEIVRRGARYGTGRLWSSNRESPLDLLCWSYAR